MYATRWLVGPAAHARLLWARAPTANPETWGPLEEAALPT